MPVPPFTGAPMLTAPSSPPSLPTHHQTTDPNVRNPAEEFLRRAEEEELVRSMCLPVCLFVLFPPLLPCCPKHKGDGCPPPPVLRLVGLPATTHQSSVHRCLLSTYLPIKHSPIPFPPSLPPPKNSPNSSSTSPSNSPTKPSKTTAGNLQACTSKTPSRPKTPNLPTLSVNAG